MTPELNLPPYPYRLAELKGKPLLYDDFRKKWVAHTPEEWVRQHILHYLVNGKGYLPGLIAVERKIKAQKQQINRFDVLCYNHAGQPFLLVECKAPSVEINQDVFMQTAHYNSTLKAKYIVVSNGLTHYAAEADYGANTFRFMQEIPAFY